MRNVPCGCGTVLVCLPSIRPCSPIHRNDINYDIFRPLNGTEWRGVVVYWREDDPRCGPGAYEIRNVYLPLRAPSRAAVTFEISLFEFDNVTFTVGYRVNVAYISVPTLNTFSARFANFPLPPGFIADTISSRFHLISWAPTTPGITLEYYDVVDHRDGLPISGFADPVAPVVSNDDGASFEVCIML
jgi:hypothetical protein